MNFRSPSISFPSPAPAGLYSHPKDKMGTDMKTSTFISAPAALALLILSTIAGAQDSGTGARVWTLQECIDYALENNITVRQNVNTYISVLISVSDLLVKLS